MGLTLLLIDDSAVMRKMIARAVRQGGLEVSTLLEAGDGQQGLDQLGGNAVDLVICDWNMPVMDGLQFVKQARTTSEVPIVMLTTEGGEAKVSAATSAGADGYMTKPFTPDNLVARLRLVLDAAA